MLRCPLFGPEDEVGAQPAAAVTGVDDTPTIELPMLVGHYHMVAMTLNALGVEREAGVEGFPPDPGATR